MNLLQIAREYVNKQEFYEDLRSQVLDLDKTHIEKKSENNLLKNEIHLKNEMKLKKTAEYETLLHKNVIRETENAIKKEKLKPKIKNFESLQNLRKQKEGELIELNKLKDYDEYAHLYIKLKDFKYNSLTDLTPEEKSKCLLF